MKSIVKFIIQLFASLIKNNKEALKFLYTKALNKETQAYIDYGYGETYPHIEKSSEIAKKFKFENDLIVDIGGARGYTAYLFHQFQTNANIKVFEPLAENIPLIKKQLQGIKNIEIIAKALGNEIGEQIINRSSRVTSSSLLEFEASIDSDYMKEALKENVTEKIVISTLDEELKSIDRVGIIKIDVQGYEVEVLKGGVETLKKTSLVVVEVSNHHVYKNAPMYFDVDEILRSNGFVLYDNCLTFKEQGRLREWDAIYVNASLLK